MARILYALSGEGQGHVSRVLAIAAMLRNEGHELLFCAGGRAEEVLRGRKEPLVSVPALLHAVHQNRMQYWKTLQLNFPAFWKQREVIQDLVRVLERWQPDLLINDFEAFSWRAAAKLGIPILSLNNQELLTEGKLAWTLQDRLAAFPALWSIWQIAPRQVVHRILTTFFEVALHHPHQTSLIPPILRPEILHLKPVNEGYLLVYLNRAKGSNLLLERLVRLGKPCRIYGFDEMPSQQKNLVFRATSSTSFLEDLANCEAILCTAGFSLLSEALYLQKPVLAMPNHGQFEQVLNARYVAEKGWGHMIHGQMPTQEELNHFVERLPILSNCFFHQMTGNQQALTLIQQQLNRSSPKTLQVEALPN